jgi:hypothetical protein
MRAWAYPPKYGSYFVKWTSAWLSEDDTSGDNHSNLRSGTSGTDNRQCASDSRRPLVHSLQTEVSFCAKSPIVGLKLFPTRLTAVGFSGAVSHCNARCQAGISDEQSDIGLQRFAATVAG